MFGRLLWKTIGVQKRPSGVEVYERHRLTGEFESVFYKEDEVVENNA